MSQPTIVTAMLDIGRSRISQQFRRDESVYLKSLRRLARLDLPMHVFAEQSLHEQILKWRRGKPTFLHTFTAEQLRSAPGYQQIQAIRLSAEWQSQAEWLANSPMAELELYIPLVMSKMAWLEQASLYGDANDTYIWIDAGIHMHLNTGEHGLVNEHYFRHLISESSASTPAKLKLFAKAYEQNTEVHGFDRQALATYCGTDFVDRCCKGGVFGGSASVIQKLAPIFRNHLLDTLDARHLGTEECILTILSYRHPELTEVTLLNNTRVPALFSPVLPKLSTRRLRHPRAAFLAARRRILQKWHSWRHAPKNRRILGTIPIDYTATDAFDLHILLCARDVLNGIWTLRSFLHYSGLKPRLIIHDDGSLDAEHQLILKQHFPQALIITYQQAQQDMAQALSQKPASYRYRITEYSWPAIKLLDFAHYSKERAFLVLDADVLFFKYPAEIVQAITQNKGFFMSDWQDAYTWPLSRWPAVLGTNGLPRVNVGLFYLPDGNLYDSDYVEHCLQAYYTRQPCPRANWLEQTVWAALFSRLGSRMIRLPDSYQISKQRELNASTCSHHFVNDSRLSRLDMSAKGIPLLISNGFLATQEGKL